MQRLIIRGEFTYSYSRRVPVGIAASRECLKGSNNPGGFQTSGINTPKDYSVENGIVKGRDEDTDNFDNKVYKGAVSFAARLPEKKS